MPWTEAQRTANIRNHRIWRLRGVWWNHGQLDPDLQAELRAVIDKQLERLNAEPEGQREARRREEAHGL